MRILNKRTGVTGGYDREKIAHRKKQYDILLIHKPLSRFSCISRFVL